MMSKSRSDNAVLSINGGDYGCIISGISKSEQANVLKKGDLNENVEHYRTQFFTIFLYERWVKKL